MASGCRVGAPEPPAAAPPPAIDLLAELPFAEVAREPGRVVLGTPAARRWLGEGWSRNQRQGDERFVWSTGERAVFDLFLTRPRATPVTFSVRPFAWPGAPPQRLRVELGGATVAAVGLAPGRHTYRLELPTARLRAGRNRLVFHHAWSRRPADVLGSKDRRRLAVAWFWIDFRPGAPGAGTPTPRADPAARRLILPAGSRTDFYLDLVPGSTLVLDGIAVRGDARLDVTSLAEGATERRLPVRPGAGADGPVRLPLGSGLLRLRLTARSESGGGAILLERPRVEAAPATGRAAPRSLRAAGTASGETATAAEDRVPTATPAVVRAAGPHPGPRPGPRPGHRHGHRPDVIVYLVDTLRSDRLGCYGATRPTTPRIDAFARRAVLFTHARAQAPWTKPSVASIFTGLWPPAHGTIGFEDRLPAALPILPELLQRAGYATAAVSANGFVTAAFGFDRGFDSFVVLADPATRGEAVVDAGLAWLDRHRAAGDGRPFFLYLHSIDPHAPYDPPADLRRRWAPGVDPALGSAQRMEALSHRRRLPAHAKELARRLGALYDAEVAAADRAFGHFLDGLAARGLAEDTLLVFVSDHGEELGEHGRWTHGVDLHREALSIPLLIQLPGRRLAGRRVTTAVEHLDLLPTLLAATGTPPPPDRRRVGVDLLALAAADPHGGRPETEARAADAPELDPRPVFSHLDYFANRGVSLEQGRWKLVVPGGSLGHEPRLYDLVADPSEHQDVASTHPLRVGWMATAIRRRRAGAASPAPEKGAMDAETRARLRALGYLR